MAIGTTLGRGGSRPGETYWAKPKTTTPKPTAPKATTPRYVAPSVAPTGRVAKEVVEQEKPAWLSGSMSISGSGGGTETDYYSDLLTEQQRAAQERKQAALERNNSYIPQINQYADKRLQDAYILKEQNRVNLPQQLSALGYSGGATETSLMGAMTDYENRRGGIEEDRGQALNDIYQNAAQIEATGNADLADIAASYYGNMITKAQQDEAAAQSNYRWQTEFNAEQADNDYNNRWAVAQYLAGLGDYSGLQALGINVNASTDQNGSTPTTRKTTTPTVQEPSGNYNTVFTNVQRALGGSNVGSGTAWDAAINYIQNSLKQGVITESEAQQMLGRLGLD